MFFTLTFLLFCIAKEIAAPPRPSAPSVDLTFYDYQLADFDNPADPTRNLLDGEDSYSTIPGMHMWYHSTVKEMGVVALDSAEIIRGKLVLIPVLVHAEVTGGEPPPRAMELIEHRSSNPQYRRGLF